jgi:hypothetical protein
VFFYSRKYELRLTVLPCMKKNDMTALERQHRDIYAQVGAAVGVSQALELTLTNLLLCNGKIRGTATTVEEFQALEETLKKTLGKLLQKVRNAIRLPKKTSKVITLAIEKRNLLIHHILRDKAFCFASAAGRKKLLAEVEQIRDILRAADKLANEILKELVREIGITPDMLDAEFQKLKSQSERY